MLEIKARAKINLTLDILGIRPDGYHEVEMVMQTINLHDYLLLQKHPEGIRLFCNNDEVPINQHNLVYRAAILLQEYTGYRLGGTIFLYKNIPIAAGLAGGSADAAATLKGLNKLWRLKLTGSELIYLGERLGADVPFCLTGGTALARGKGEQINSLPSPPRLGVILVKPSFGISTAWAYRQYDLTSGMPRPDTHAMLIAIKNKDVRKISSLLNNVLEHVTVSFYPEIQEIKKALLNAGVMGAAMSGSGPTVFGLCQDEDEARAVAARLKRGPGWRVWVTTTAGNE